MVPSNIFCPKCGAELKAASTLQPGTEVSCPACSTVFVIPDVSPPESSTQPPAYNYEPDGISTAPSAQPQSRRITPEVDSSNRADWRDRQRGYPEEDEDHPRRYSGEYGLDEGEGRTGPLSNQYEVEFGRWFEIAMAHFSDRNFWVMAALYTLLAFVLTQVIAQIPYVGPIVNLFVSPALYAGLTGVALKHLKGRSWAFSDFFCGFKGEHFLSLVGFNFVTGLLIALPIIPGGVLLAIGALSNDPNLTTTGLAVLAVLLPISIFLSVRLTIFGVPLILDRRYRAMEAIQGCWELTADHFWMLFGVQLVLGLITLAGVLALCIGYLVAVPFVTLVLSTGYLLVAGTQAPLQRPSGPYEDRY